MSKKIEVKKPEEPSDYSPFLKKLFLSTDTNMYTFFRYLSKDIDKVDWSLSKKATEIVRDISKQIEEEIPRYDSSETKNIGLKNIEIADSKIATIDGYRGNLIYRGYDILDLTKNSTFEETAYLLLYDNLPTNEQLDEFNSKLIDARFIPKQMQKNMGNWRKDASATDMLQAFVSELDGFYDHEFSNKEDSYNKAISIIAKIPTIITSWQRIRNGLDIIYPDPSLSHAANFLYMMFGEKPDSEIEKLFDVCLILYADYMLDISTFTARLVASTRSTMFSTVSASIGTLNGKSYGGVSTEVMKLLFEIGTIEKVESHIQEKIKNEEKIPGMGNEDFKVFDPRAMVLKELSRKLAEKTEEPWFDMTEKIEVTTISEMKKQKDLDVIPNANLYSASIYYMLKIPIDLNPLIFATSRVAGWVTHIIEEKFAEAAPRPVMYHPDGVYVGKYCGPIGCKYEPLELRK